MIDPRGLGYIRDRIKQPGEDPDLLFSDHEAALTTPPPSFSLVEYILSVLDQGQLGSCVANAITQALRMRQAIQGVVGAELGSRLFLYWCARAAAHTTGQDAGTMPRTAFEQLNKFGLPPEEEWPYSDGPDLFKRQPSQAAIRAAYDLHAPTEYRSISSTGNARIADMKRAIAAGFPVPFGVSVSNAFCQGNFDASKPILPPTSDIAGGHCLLAVGYDGDNFDIQNSWGEDFGYEKGRIWFSPQYILQATDPWQVDHAAVEGEV